MKYSLVFVLAIAAVATTVSTGCVESQSGNVFSRDEARQAAEVYEGTVVDVREGKIEGSQSGVGAIGGGAMGGAVGSTIGGGSGNALGIGHGAYSSFASFFTGYYPSNGKLYFPETSLVRIGEDKDHTRVVPATIFMRTDAAMKRDT